MWCPSILCICGNHHGNKPHKCERGKELIELFDKIRKDEEIIKAVTYLMPTILNWLCPFCEEVRSESESEAQLHWEKCINVKLNYENEEKNNE